MNVKKQPATQCRACGTINISKYVNVLSRNPTTLILSSLASEFDKESKNPNLEKMEGGEGTFESKRKTRI